MCPRQLLRRPFFPAFHSVLRFFYLFCSVRPNSVNSAPECCPGCAKSAPKSVSLPQLFKSCPDFCPERPAPTRSRRTLPRFAVWRTGTTNRPEGQQLHIHHGCSVFENPWDCLHHVLDKSCADQSLKGDGDLFQLLRRLAQLALEHGRVLEHADHLLQFVQVVLQSRSLIFLWDFVQHSFEPMVPIRALNTGYSKAGGPKLYGSMGVTFTTSP